MNELKSCKSCNLKFQVTGDDLKFYESVSPVFGGKKYLIPPPTLCPNCRQQRRLSFCNEFNLYPGECGMCKKRTLTEHPPHSNQPILCKECWHSDKWEPRDFGRDVDFSRPFFEQIYELKRAVPAQALTIDGENLNCDYMHYAGSSKNGYLIMHADFCENCSYGYGFKKVVSCVDGFYNLHSELCYDCVDVYKCYGLKGCQDCVNCSSSAFLRDCIGCQNCFLSVGLRNKQYFFENKQLSKEEYEKKMGEIDLGSYAQYQKCRVRLKELEKDYCFKQFHTTNVQNCSGDYLKNCKDVQFGFDCEDVEGGKYLFQMVLGSKNVYDIYQYGTNLQASYECCISGANGYGLLFTLDGHMSSKNLAYCWYIEHGENLFGCVSMHHRSYCILNKQYSKEEYEALVPKIIEHMQKTGEWGEFFDSKIALFGYNKTTAQMWFPLAKDEAVKRGFKWDDYEVPRPNVDKVLKAADLPDNVADVSDDILQAAIECEESGKLFKLTPFELGFYRDNRLPLPRKAFYQRHLERFSRRNPRKFFRRNCEKCEKEILTTYTKELGDKVCCEECFMKLVY